MPCAEHVVPHEDLPARPGTGADTNGRYLDRLGDILTQLTRDRFQYDGKGASLFECVCGSNKGLGGCDRASLYAVAREGGGSLGEETNVCHDGYPDLGECGHVWDEFLSAFEFDSFDVALLDHPHGCADGIARAGSVSTKGHVGDEQGCGGAARDGPAVMEHLVEGETGGGGVAEADLGEGIADEGDIDGVGRAGAGGGEIVGCEDGDGGIGGAEFGEACDGGFFG